MWSTSTTISVTAKTSKNEKRKGRCPGGLAHVVRGVFYSGVANRRQLQNPNSRGGVGDWVEGGGGTGGRGALTPITVVQLHTGFTSEAWC